MYIAGLNVKGDTLFGNIFLNKSQVGYFVWGNKFAHPFVCIGGQNFVGECDETQLVETQIAQQAVKNTVA